MNPKKLFGGLVAIALITLAIYPAIKSHADTQVMQTGYLLPRIGDFLNGNMVQVPLNSNTNLTPGTSAAIVSVPPGCSLSIWPVFVVTNANANSMASNITITLATSPWTNSANAEVAATPVGTTMFTTNFTTGLTFAPTGDGTNTVMAYGYFSWTNIAAAKVTLVNLATTFTNVGGVNVSNVFYRIVAPQ